MSGSIQAPFCDSTLWSSEPGSGVRQKNSRISSGSSFLMISMSWRIELRRVVREAQDVAGIGDHARSLPREQHVAILGDAVLPLLRLQQVVGVDVLQPDEHTRHAGTRGLFNEIRQLVAQGVDLDDQADLDAVALADLDDPVEDRLPVLVACEIIVGDEEAAYALRPVLLDQVLDVVR